MSSAYLRSVIDTPSVPNGRPSFILKVSKRARLLFVLGVSLLIAIMLDHSVASWIKLPSFEVPYRRIGPQSGPQVFCAGSSLTQFGLSWPEISEQLGQGIETWAVGAGSSPVEWEVFQNLPTNTNLMIVGVSVYDLNEQYFCDARANIVPFRQTLADLRASDADWDFTKRSLGQYPITWLRRLFPTAGKADDVMVGLRRKLPKRLRGSSGGEDDDYLVMPQKGTMIVAGSKKRVSDWTKARALRRVALMRGENHRLHTFSGPKHLAFQRILLKDQKRGRVIVVVLPVSPMYVQEFLTPETIHNFETALTTALPANSKVEFVRLDQVTSLQSNDYYSDLVHLNGAGREIATAAFLDWLKQHPAKP